jgi:hypothetical protein
VYERPVDLWSARLTGPASVLAVRVLGSQGDRASLDVAGQALSVPAAGPAAGSIGAATAVIRPDWVSLGGPLGGDVSGTAYRGTHTDVTLATEAGAVGIRVPGAPTLRRGDAITWGLDRVWLIPRDETRPNPPLSP